MFNALLLTQSDDRATHAALTELDESKLPEGEVRVEVEYSTVNYKDGARHHRQAPVVRKFPDGARHRLRRHRGRQQRPRCKRATASS